MNYHIDSLQFSGINIIMQYTVEIFESADSSINEYLATIFVGVALLVSENLGVHPKKINAI